MPKTTRGDRKLETARKSVRAQAREYQAGTRAVEKRGDASLLGITRANTTGAAAQPRSRRHHNPSWTQVEASYQ